MQAKARSILGAKLQCALTWLQALKTIVQLAHTALESLNNQETLWHATPETVQLSLLGQLEICNDVQTVAATELDNFIAPEAKPDENPSEKAFIYSVGQMMIFLLAPSEDVGYQNVRLVKEKELDLSELVSILACYLQVPEYQECVTLTSFLKSMLSDNPDDRYSLLKLIFDLDAMIAAHQTSQLYNSASASFQQCHTQHDNYDAVSTATELSFSSSQYGFDYQNCVGDVTMMQEAQYAQSGLMVNTESPTSLSSRSIGLFQQQPQKYYLPDYGIQVECSPEQLGKFLPDFQYTSYPDSYYASDYGSGLSQGSDGLQYFFEYVDPYSPVYPGQYDVQHTPANIWRI